MSAQAFLADVENGAVPVDSHEKVLWIAFIYMDEGLWDDNGVLSVIEKLHAHGWSFGQGELRFNRTLDLFYLAQIAAAIYRSDQITGVFPSPDEFEAFYTEHHALLHPSAWRSYYSEPFLKHHTTSRFYRLPNLQHLPDADSPLDAPRKRPRVGGGPHALKLPCWAYSVARTHRRQPFLPLATLTEIALRTLEATITRLCEAHPGVPRYSETQARFWLEDMGLRLSGPRTKPKPKSGSGSGSKTVPRAAWDVDRFGILAAQGYYDVYEWEGKYSVQAWEASWERNGGGVVKPDVEEGVWKSEVMWCGGPDGGIGAYAWWRGWEAELGSEEEVEFLAAVAVEEVAGVRGLEGLDLAVRSHILLGVMWAAVKTGLEREEFLQELETGMVQSGRIGEDNAGIWLREALGIIEPYVRNWEGAWPHAELFRRILVDNGQLFARWKVSPQLKEFNFELGPRELQE
ncbi:hypothetical protein BJY00DRAFT_289510 [Aspergillus carlsbadensis]|nr:hypothetical protein BJY00DRAFT_289510 [Aspergillus carlsbadensis]